jgi:spermidine synthase
MDRVNGDEMMQPYIVETKSERRLHFTGAARQSVMQLDDPDTLVTDYTRKMMSFLLFNPDPLDILMIGLGGGSLPKFCYRQLRDALITVVEINEHVIALRDKFCVPKDDARFRVVHDDGARYVAQLTERVDVILVDAFDADGIALSLANSEFYPRAAEQLTDDGVLVVNLSGQGARCADNIRAVRAAFGKNMVQVRVASGGNTILFAFKQPPPPAITDELELLSRRLQSRLLLDFPRYLRRFFQRRSLGAL